MTGSYFVSRENITTSSQTAFEKAFNLHDMSEQETRAQTLLDEGKLAYKNSQYEASVNKLGEACQLL